jgi:hypothetical protein
MLIGFDRHVTAIAISILTVAVLAGINFLESSLVIMRKGIYARLPFHKKKDLDQPTESSTD